MKRTLRTILAIALAVFAATAMQAQASKSTLYTGSGSPAGRISANAGDFYVDTVGGTFYVKSQGSDSNGWQQLASSSATGPTHTCDSSTLANYQPAYCSLNLTADQLNSFDGMADTGLQFVAAPANGKIILPTVAAVEFLAGMVPYSQQLQPDLGWGSSGNAPVSGPSISTAADSWGYAAALNTSATPMQVSGQELLLWLDSQIANTRGPIGTSSLNTGGIADGANTTQVSSGHAGTMYAMGDGFELACGATFIVDTVDGDGAALTYHQTAPGGSCITGTNEGTDTQSGAGSGLDLDVLTIGALYRVNDTFVDNACGTPATGHVTAVDANGLITTYALDTLGDGCQVGTDSLNQTSGLGSGAVINVESVTTTAGDGTAVVFVQYTVVPVQ